MPLPMPWQNSGPDYWQLIKKGGLLVSRGKYYLL